MFKPLFETRLPSSSCPQSGVKAGLDLPVCMDVRFGVEEDQPDLLIHEFREDVLHVVNSMYETDSGSPAMNSGTHHQSLLDAYLGHLQPVLDRVGAKDIALLEVGCGEGRVVHALANAGYSDISACEGASFPFHDQLKGVKLIHDYARPGIFAGQRFDVIFSKTVFEHIPGLQSVLADMQGLLKPNGLMFFSVPNCGPEIELGDPRMLALQHWNYFTANNVGTLLAATGYELVEIAAGRGDLFVTCRPANERPTAPSAREPDARLLDYAGKLRKNLSVLQKRIDALKGRGATVAIYGVDFNLPSMLDWDGVDVRMVDSDPSKWGMLYSNDPAAEIRSPDTLVTKPVAEVWVAPITYDAPIREFLRGHLANTPTKVVSLKELYEGSSPS
jgi:2-polyprenyl-3-methyl-5-hydroxy-6-metoxy-1,4-benzoquinol methylase